MADTAPHAPKTARQSFGQPWVCQKPWPEDCFVQCGGSGIVIGNAEKDSYTTAFFEAFPKEPKTFIRGEGNDVAAAEANAWDKFQKILACDQHEFVRYGTEHGICKKCKLFQSNIFPPEASCSVCGKPHVNASGPDKSPMCHKHSIEAWLAQDAAEIASNAPRASGLAGFFDGTGAAKFARLAAYRHKVEAEMGLIDLDAAEDWKIMQNDPSEDFYRWVWGAEEEGTSLCFSDIRKRLVDRFPDLLPVAAHHILSEVTEYQDINGKLYRSYLEGKLGLPQTMPLSELRDLIFETAVENMDVLTEKDAD